MNLNVEIKGSEAKSNSLHYVNIDSRLLKENFVHGCIETLNSSAFILSVAAALTGL